MAAAKVASSFFHASRTASMRCDFPRVAWGGYGLRDDQEGVSGSHALKTCEAEEGKE